MPGFQYYLNWPCASQNLSQWNLMSISFFLLGCTFFVTTACAAKFSVYIGVLGCGCPISDSVILCGTASLALIYIALISASDADVMTALMIWDILKTASLLAGIAALLDMKNSLRPCSLLLVHSGKRHHCGMTTPCHLHGRWWLLLLGTLHNLKMSWISPFFLCWACLFGCQCTQCH